MRLVTDEVKDSVPKGSQLFEPPQSPIDRDFLVCADPYPGGWLILQERMCEILLYWS